MLPSPIRLPATPPQRTRVNWAEAKAAYVALAPTDRSYERIARDFSVSSVTVRKWAARDGWVAAAAQADQKAAQAALRQAERTREQRVREAVRFADDYTTVAAARLKDGKLDVKAADVPGLQKMAELLEGEATDRVELSSVQQVLLAVLQVAGRYVPAGKRPAFLADVDEAVGGLLQPAGEASA